MTGRRVPASVASVAWFAVALGLLLAGIAVSPHTDTVTSTALIAAAILVAFRGGQVLARHFFG